MKKQSAKGQLNDSDLNNASPFLKLWTRLWKQTQVANKVDKVGKIADFGLK